MVKHFQDDPNPPPFIKALAPGQGTQAESRAFVAISGETAMASNARVFFAGVGTTFVILAIGFGGGLMVAKTAMEPSASSHSIADQLPPVRVILPASAEAAMPPQPPVEPAAAPEPSPSVMTVKETQQALEKETKIERAERRKAEADERARRKKYAERKARREAARLVNRQQEQQPGILAFGGDGDQSRGGAGLFFGN
jgi:type IV secretory pathway VirB10-like protein